MKILRIIARLNVGGPARHVIWLTDRMRRRGHESLLVAGTVPDEEEDMSYFADLHSVRPLYLQEMSRELSGKDIVSFWKLYRVMRRESPDVVHTHTAKAGTVGRTAAFFYRWGTWKALVGKPRPVRIVHTFHGHVLHGYYGAFKSGLFLKVERALARFATDRIVVISDQQLRELNGRYRIGHRNKFDIIPLGIDLDSFSHYGSTSLGELRRDIGLGSDTILIAFIGRLTEIKDVPLLLTSLHKAVNVTDPPPMELAVIGDGHLRADLEELVRELNIEHKVSFLGNRENVAELLNGVDVVALTSKNEGTPLSLIEAMAAGKTIVATAVGGVVDLLGRELEKLSGFAVCERGIAVTTRSPDDFASALIYAAQNGRLRERLSKAGRIFVRENYSIDRLEEDILRLYEKLLNPGSRT